MALRQITLRVNGQDYTGQAEVRKTLADFIREDCGLTGTHLGCEHGVCGACTILMNGEAVRSCLLFAVQAEGTELMTVEGLADGDQLHPIQQAYWEHHALQCGFCTPGFLMTTYDFLRDTPHPSEREIREGLAGNLCRCTGYQNIVKAVAAAAKTLSAGARLEPAWAVRQRTAAGPAHPPARAAGAATAAGEDGSLPSPRPRRSAQARRTKKNPTARKAPGRQRRPKR
jgi:aerobic-type carbon monoxide dehydrogenase small subunit (CoxS/CutS family)